MHYERAPVADFCAFQIDSQIQLAPAWKYDERCARILSVWRIDRHRRPRHVTDAHCRTAGDQKLFPSRFSDLRPGDSLRIRYSGTAPGHIGTWL